MKKKVLVYDNQLGYHSLLKDTVKQGYDFLLFDKKENHNEHYDAVVFFLHDDLELIDMVRLYDPEIPFILGTSKKNVDFLEDNGIVYTIDISRTKDKIEKKLQAVFKEITRLSEKEEAL